MFHSLSGTISGHAFPLVYLSTGSVEWELEVSAATYQECLRDGRERRLFTYLHHREDIMRLYGFATEEERHAFLQLITVSGIGPRQALKILSGITVQALYTLLEEEDVAGLTRLPGLGAKTAQKILLQLKGKIVTGDATADTPEDDDITLALIEMGYDRKAVKKTLTALRPETSEEQELFHRAIVELSR